MIDDGVYFIKSTHRRQTVMSYEIYGGGAAQDFNSNSNTTHALGIIQLFIDATHNNQQHPPSFATERATLSRAQDTTHVPSEKREPGSGAGASFGA